MEEKHPFQGRSVFTSLAALMLLTYQLVTATRHDGAGDAGDGSMLGSVSKHGL